MRKALRVSRIEPIIIGTACSSQQASPPFSASAQNSVLALQVRGAPERATLMARMLLVVYVAAAVPLSLLITCFLQATGVGAML